METGSQPKGSDGVTAGTFNCSTVQLKNYLLPPAPTPTLVQTLLWFQLLPSPSFPPGDLFLIFQVLGQASFSLCCSTCEVRSENGHTLLCSFLDPVQASAPALANTISSISLKPVFCHCKPHVLIILAASPSIWWVFDKHIQWTLMAYTLDPERFLLTRQNKAEWRPAAIPRIALRHGPAGSLVFTCSLLEATPMVLKLGCSWNPLGVFKNSFCLSPTPRHLCFIDLRRGLS